MAVLQHRLLRFGDILSGYRNYGRVFKFFLIHTLCKLPDDGVWCISHVHVAHAAFSVQ